MKIVHAEGQTCNQFWIYSNFIADCIEKREKFAIWIPDITFRYFPNLGKSEYVSFPLYSEALAKLFGYNRYIYFLSRLFANKYSIVFFKLFLNNLKNICFIYADVEIEKSKFRIKHLNKIRYIYKPNDSIVEEVDDIFAKKREQFSLIVGIHIRYGDYRTFNNGRYFYTLMEYQGIMQKMIDLFPNQKITFLIASNENIDHSTFCNLNFFTIPTCSAVKDLYALSKCNYIIGPPSTFSGWASLYGDVPILFIENVKDIFTIDSFKPIYEIWY